MNLREISGIEKKEYYAGAYSDLLYSLEKMEISKEKFARELYEICTYPNIMPWEGVSQDAWRYRASIIIDNLRKCIIVKE